jgi:hypothetical protein
MKHLNTADSDGNHSVNYYQCRDLIAATVALAAASHGVMDCSHAMMVLIFTETCQSRVTVAQLGNVADTGCLAAVLELLLQCSRQDSGSQVCEVLVTMTR